MSSQNSQVGGPPIASALAVVVRCDSVLLVRRRNRPDRGMWGFPGGKLNDGESTLSAAKRELFEETRRFGKPDNCLADASFDATSKRPRTNGSIRDDPGLV